jgi:hypothetical protein
MTRETRRAGRVFEARRSSTLWVSGLELLKDPVRGGRRRAAKLPVERACPTHASKRRAYL